MNERIKELIKQAMVLEESDGLFVREVFDKEKFAELIIQECLDCSTWVGKMNKHSVESIHTSHAINKRIKKLFGVE
jgi:hypothetical protein